MAILQNNQKIGKYEVKRLIKENRYCETYRVEDENEEPFFLKLYILKNTPEKMLDDNHQVTSIHLASQLQHKNIILFVEQGTYQNDEVGTCQYMVTNYFNGELVADKLQREGTLPEDQALQIFRDVVEGLIYLHDMGLLHNDITPRNIMISDKTGEAELIDLGHLSTSVCGNPPFDTSDLDDRYQSSFALMGGYNNSTDFFSAISVLYTMLTGDIPWNVSFPEDADRKSRIKIAFQSRKEIFVTDKMRNFPINVYSVVHNGLVLGGGCVWRDGKTILKELDKPDEDTVSTPSNQEKPKDKPSPKDDFSKKQDEEPQADVEIQKGNGHGFEDIAGMNDLKQMLQQKVIFMLKDKEKAEKYKLVPPNGMLFYGPPGCGKSFFAEKFAEETGFNFMLVKASDLGSIFIHGSQEKIADLFKKAQKKAPTIICFDEFDAFVPNRSGRGSEHQAGEVNEFLTQLNNCGQRGIFVIATSNRPDMIDPAVLRTGRIDKMVYIPMPDKEARQEMFKMYLNGRPCEEIDTARLADLTDGYISSDIAYIVNDAAMGAAFSDQPITQQMLEDTISSIRPSINKEVARQYEDLRCKMENIDRNNARPKIGFV